VERRRTGEGQLVPFNRGGRSVGDDDQRHMARYTAERCAAMVKRIDVFYNNLRRHSSRVGTCPEQCTNRQRPH
jgi:hypothetical protein